MDKLDQLIAEAFAEEDRSLIEETGEQGIFRQLTGVFQGRNAWVHWLVTLAMLAYAGVALWAAWQFFTAAEVLVVLRWGVIGTVSILVIGMLKLYLLGEMQTERVIRQLKRVELRLASRDK